MAEVPLLPKDNLGGQKKANIIISQFPGVN
jgi:hypothetical protein